MIRVLFVLAVIGLGYYLLTNQGGTPAKPEEVYQREVEQINSLEQQLQDQAQQQLQALDEATAKPD